MEKRIYIRVPEQLLKEFDRACKANYTTKSEVLRRAMLEYVRETKKEDVKMTRINCYACDGDFSEGGYSMERIKEALTKAGIPYVTECLGGNIEGVRLGHGMYIVEHGSGEGYYVGTLEDENDACYTLEEALELAKA